MVGALRALGVLVLVLGYLASMAGAILVRPYRRWTTPRELVVLDPDELEGRSRHVVFEGWSIERDCPDDYPICSITVRRGASLAELDPLYGDTLLFRSDDAGTFIDADRRPWHPCGLSSRAIPSRETAFLAGLVVLLALCVIGFRARREVARAIADARSPGASTYRATGIVPRDTHASHRAIAESAAVSAATTFAIALLVTTWVLAVVGVFD